MYEPAYDNDFPCRSLFKTVSIDGTYAHTYAIVNYGKTPDDLKNSYVGMTGNVPEDTDDDTPGEDDEEY